MSKPIVVIGTLDAKGHEVAYIRNLIQARGHQTLAPGSIAVGVSTIQKRPFLFAIGRMAESHPGQQRAFQPRWAHT